MTITIRHEKEKDHRIVEEITREAFWNLYFPGAVEHLLVHNIRKHPDFIPELSFVIALDNEIIGSIFYTKAKVIDKHGGVHPIITFGPVSISPEYQRQGFGRMLIEHSLAEAKRLGFNAIILGGFTYHYHPYGFVGTKKYNISMPDGKFYTGVMALPLFEGALDGISGSVHFSEAMYPYESILNDFDKTFPPKEKKVLPHQSDFEKAVSEIDTYDY
ncbi:GCN5 family acetyltransferase [Enterococcus innesii]|uniref:GCN5 family acetyltransferase n=1 Tax=Enterococcus innesii TaxID=2839759 RepID=A0ABN6NKU2_9ENTE|nr:N-acetyltransferase [Enterococcus innesii]OOG26229.1 GNAT family N-acetyltransferase [Enterococcus casseliflavus]BDG66620.1 GCN5 family acetyltransferase [Enterococcus innesii]